MISNYEIDSVDKKILACLQEDARVPYLEIARKLIVSGGTIHQRIDRLKKLGILKGSTIELDYSKLGYDVSVILGIHLKSAKDQTKVIERLAQMREVTEINYTTGNFALMIKVVTKTINEFHHFLVEKLQDMTEIQSTESFICLDQPYKKLIQI
ncbi:MAG: Lrp/AsnC family transcriptional regulator for asnA, asnC and gidA [Thermoproteota archaeon]|jgi:Lrp/AsnC family transcriptional regulator for asnA, asnC and gidA